MSFQLAGGDPVFSAVGLVEGSFVGDSLASSLVSSEDGSDNDSVGDWEGVIGGELVLGAQAMIRHKAAVLRIQRLQVGENGRRLYRL